MLIFVACLFVDRNFVFFFLSADHAFAINFHYFLTKTSMMMTMYYFVNSLLVLNCKFVAASLLFANEKRRICDNHFMNSIIIFYLSYRLCVHIFIYLYVYLVILFFFFCCYFFSWKNSLFFVSLFSIATDVNLNFGIIFFVVVFIIYVLCAPLSTYTIFGIVEKYSIHVLLH